MGFTVTVEKTVLIRKLWSQVESLEKQLRELKKKLARFKIQLTVPPGKQE